MQFVQPIPFHDAVGLLGNKTVVASGLDTAAWQMVPVGLRQRAFFSSKIENARFLQRTKDLLNDFLTKAKEEVTLKNGTKVWKLKVGSRADFVQKVREFALAEGMGPLDPKDKGTLQDITSEKRISLIFKIQTESAYGYGDWLQGMNPVVLNEYPAWQFYRQMAVKTPRVIHQQNEGVIQLKTNLSFWLTMNSSAIGGFDVPYGPWGFGSGMWTRDVDRSKAEALGLIDRGEVLKPAIEDFNKHLAAGVRNLDQAMQGFLKESFGDQIEIRDGEARWVPGQTPPVRPNPRPIIHPKPQRPEPAPVTPSQPTTPSVPEPEPLDEASRTAKRLEAITSKIGLQVGKPVSVDQVTQLRAALRKPSPLRAADVADIYGTQKLSAPAMETAVNDWLSYIPPELAKARPPLSIHAMTKSEMGTTLGKYLPGGIVHIRQDLGYNAASTIFHELTHWLHLEDVSSQWYRDLIVAHFEKRTAGEKLQYLPGYGQAKGKTDKWYDVYAGRIYSHYPLGSEIPTRYFELFALPDDELVEYFNRPGFLETMLVVLRIFV